MMLARLARARVGFLESTPRLQSMRYSFIRGLPGLARRSFALAVIATTLGLAYGIWYSYGVFLVALLGEFSWSRSLLAGAFSVFAIVHGVANPFVGLLCDRVRPPVLVGIGGAMLTAALWTNSTITAPWQLYAGFGVATALSVATCGWLPAVVMVERRYKHRLGLAMGIVSSGIGVGMLTVVPLCQALIDGYGWRTAFRVLGLVCAVWFIPAAIYLARTSPRSTRPPGADFVHELADTVAETPSATTGTEPSITLAAAVRTGPFWLMVSAFFFGSMCSQTLHVHQVAYLVDHGITAMVAASVVGAVGLASIAGKTGGGWLSDRIEREIVFIGGIAILVASVGVLAAMRYAPSAWLAYVYAIMLGVGYSATASLVPAMMSDRFSGLYFGSIVGIGLFGSAAGSATGPWLAGVLFDRFGSYDWAFVIAAACGTVSGIAGWVARVRRRRRDAVI